MGEAPSQRFVLRQLKSSVALRLLGQIIIWVSTFVTIRLLTPADYGLLALATMVIGLSAFVSELGLGSSVVQIETLEMPALRAIFSLLFGINFALAALVWWQAGAIAAFFSAPDLQSVLRVMVLMLLINAFAVIPQGLLIRRVQMARREFIEIVAAFIGGLVTLVMAWQGQGVWSLVTGQLTMSAVRMLLSNRYATFAPVPGFAFGAAIDHIRFGGWKAANQVCWKAVSYSDSLVIGRLLTKTDLGAYSIALTIAGLPLDKLATLIRQIGFSSFSRIQKDLVKVRKYVLKTTAIGAWFSFPVFVGLSLVAPDMIPLILGDQWQAAVAPVQWICLVQPYFLLSNILGSAVDGVGRPDVNTWASFAAAIFLPAGFFLGALYSLNAVGIAWVVSMSLWFFTTLALRLRPLALSLKDYLQALARPALAVAVMAGCVMLVSSTQERGTLAALLVGMGTGVVSYALMSLLTMKTLLREIIQWARA